MTAICSSKKEVIYSWGLPPFSQLSIPLSFFRYPKTTTPAGLFFWMYSSVSWQREESFWFFSLSKSKDMSTMLMKSKCGYFIYIDVFLIKGFVTIVWMASFFLWSTNWTKNLISDLILWFTVPCRVLFPNFVMLSHKTCTQYV